jgi:hypothetical protein
MASAQTDPALWRYIHPNAKALLSLDWSHIGHSHIGTILREKFVDTGGIAIPGIEFLDDIERVVISSPGRASDADESSEPPMLIVVRGHFDTAKIRQLLISHGSKAQMFNSTPVYRPQAKSNKDMAFVILDAQTLLIGDAQSVFTRLEKNRYPTPGSGPGASTLISARAAELDGLYEFWAILSGQGAMAGNRLTELLTGGELGSEAQGVELGFSIRNGLTADVSVKFPSEAAAKSMASEMSRLLKMAVKDKVGEPAMLDLEKKLKIGATGLFAKINLRLNAQELQKNADLFAASHKPPERLLQPAPAVAAVTPVVKTDPPPPPKPERSVIRIEGLDEGIREIPYKPERPPQ